MVSYYSEKLDIQLQKIWDVKEQIKTYSKQLKINIDEATETFLDRIYTKCEQPIENKQNDLIKFQAYLNEIKKNEGLYEKNEVIQICELKAIDDYLTEIQTETLNFKEVTFVPAKQAIIGSLNGIEEDTDVDEDICGNSNEDTDMVEEVNGFDTKIVVTTMIILLSGLFLIPKYPWLGKSLWVLAIITACLTYMSNIFLAFWLPFIAFAAYIFTHSCM